MSVRLIRWMEWRRLGYADLDILIIFGHRKCFRRLNDQFLRGCFPGREIVHFGAGTGGIVLVQPGIEWTSMGSLASPDGKAGGYMGLRRDKVHLRIAVIDRGFDITALTANDELLGGDYRDLMIYRLDGRPPLFMSLQTEPT